jgi:hypothetical protein
MYKHELVRYIHTILMMVLLLRGGENCWLPRDRIELLFFCFCVCRSDFPLTLTGIHDWWWSSSCVACLWQATYSSACINNKCVVVYV